MSKINLINKLNEKLKLNEEEFFNSMGGLHDSKIENMIFNNKSFLFKILVDDLYSNFLGFPEYIELKNIYLNIEVNSLIDIKVNSYNMDINIYDIQIEKNIINFDLSPEGKIKIEYKSIYLSE